MTTTTATGQRRLSVIFQAGDERYLIEAISVFKVAEPGGINRIPRLPRPILGITQHRGRVVTVYHLGGLLFDEREAPPARPNQKIVILDEGTRNSGLLVDAIEEITPIRLPAARPGPTPALQIVQHRGRAAHVIRPEVLMQLIGQLTVTDA